jgi:hypothetical protein
MGETQIALGKSYLSARQISELGMSVKTETLWGTSVKTKTFHELRILLHRTLVERFDIDELRTLCFYLEIEYDHLPGEGISSKARELISYLERRGRISDLIDAAKDFRPDVSWDDIYQEAEAATERPPLLFYLILDGKPGQELSWTGWHAALQRLGAVGIIAPLIYTPGDWPLDLMLDFVTRFLQKRPVGKALRDARIKLYEKTNNPLGLFYVHYGPPEVRLA